MTKNSNEQIVVSVVIPTIGREALLRAIDSACNQIGGVIKEIVVCFDNTENTLIPNHDHVRKGVQIRVVHNRGRKGVATTLNCAIKAASGILISWLSDDDYYSTPIKLLRAVNIINRNGYRDQRDGILFFSDFHILDDSIALNNDDRAGLLNPHLNYIGAHVENVLTHHEYGQRCLSKGLINGCTAIFSKNLWSLVGGFQEKSSLQTIQDTVFWMSIIEKSSITAYIEGADSTSVQHRDQGQRLLSDIAAIEVDRLKTVVHLKDLRDFQLKRFSLKDHFNFFYHCQLLSVTPTSVFKLSVDNPIRQLSEFEFVQNSIAVLCGAAEIPNNNESISIWNACITAFKQLLGNGDYCGQFFDAALHLYMVVHGRVVRMHIENDGAVINFVDCPEYIQVGNIMFDYRYVITGRYNEMIAHVGSFTHNLETLLLREDLSEYWTFIDQRHFHVAQSDRLLVRAPWSFTEKP